MEPKLWRAFAAKARAEAQLRKDLKHVAKRLYYIVGMEPALPWAASLLELARFAEESAEKGKRK
jgi:hypothetical protein